MSIYSTISSTLDRSKHFTFHPLAELFIPGLTRLLWDEFNQAAITRDDYSLAVPPLHIAGYSVIQLSGLEHRGENENAQSSKQQKTRFEMLAISIH